MGKLFIGKSPTILQSVKVALEVAQPHGRRTRAPFTNIQTLEFAVELGWGSLGEELMVQL